MLARFGSPNAQAEFLFEKSLASVVPIHSSPSRLYDLLVAARHEKGAEGDHSSHYDADFAGDYKPVCLPDGVDFTTEEETRDSDDGDDDHEYCKTERHRESRFLRPSYSNLPDKADGDVEN